VKGEDERGIEYSKGTLYTCMKTTMKLLEIGEEAGNGE
jgi:hypothetical protein